MNLNNIPEELRELHQWVCYLKDKHPRQPSGVHASVKDPKTWLSFEEVCKAVDAGKSIGAGIVLTADDPYTIIDLDDVIDEAGNIDPEAQAIIDKMNSYTERSMSGKGIHIIIRATKQGLRCRKKNIEIYDKERYIALTGDLWEGRGEIEERQEEEEWLCSDVFGGEEGLEPVEVEDLVLDKDAKPPTRVKHLLRNKKFKKAWDYEAKLASMSDYDWFLASAAIEDGWEDQDVANLIIAFRRRHGGEADMKKALRSDYIKRTITKIKQSQDAPILGQLGFKVKGGDQYRSQDSEIDLLIERADGKEILINMGTTAQFFSYSHAKIRLYEHDLILPKHLSSERKWEEIVIAIRPLIKLHETTDDITEMRQCLYDFLGDHSNLPSISPEEMCQSFYMKGYKSMAKDDEGRAYMRMQDFARFAKARMGSTYTEKKVSHLVAMMGWHKETFSDPEGKLSPINLWISPLGFVEL